jgi:hypothetical protein
MRNRRRIGAPISKWERLRNGGIRSWQRGKVLGAAFDDGPHLTSQYPAVRFAFSQFNRGGLVMRYEAKFKASQLSLGNGIGHLCGGDVELQFVWAGIEAKVIGRFHFRHGPVHATREIFRRSWKVPDLVGFVLTKIGQARHAGREQARQTNNSKTFQRHTSMEEALCQSRCEKNN